VNRVGHTRRNSRSPSAIIRARLQVEKPMVGIASPHDVIDRILSETAPEAVILRKPDSYFTEKRRSESRISAYLSQLSNVSRWYWRIVCDRKGQYIAREYDVVSVLFLFLPPGVCLSLVVNHNLVKPLGRLVSKILSYRFNLLFIDPGENTRREFPWLNPIYTDDIFKPDTTVSWNRESILFVTGNKKDQRNVSSEELLAVSRALSAKGYDVRAVGKNHPDGQALSFDEYSYLVRASIVVCTASYRERRNSGTLWFLKVNAPVILYSESDCGRRQLRGHRCAKEFHSLSAVSDLVEQIASEIGK
jgi:hypothetical protein